MAELKTRKNDADVDAFLQSVENEKRVADCRAVMEIMEEVTGEKPSMWGTSIIGYGSYHYKYGSGREGDWFLTGLSPRKQSLSLYIMGGITPHEDIMARLGKYKTGKSCIYINKLEDVDLGTLRELIAAGVERLGRDGL